MPDIKSIKLSDFLKLEQSPFILGAFFNRIMFTNINNNHYFYAYTYFKRSKFVTKYDFDFIKYSKEFINQLNTESKQDNWIIHNITDQYMELRFYIKIDLVVITKKLFYDSVYKKIMSSSWAFKDEICDEQKSFIRGFMELRGSIDTTAKFISQDYYYDNRIELKKAQILTQNLNVPIQYMNFNARNMQPQFVNGINKRNSQFRIHIFYYAKFIGFMNKYKAEIFKKAYAPLSSNILNNFVYFNVSIPPQKDNVQFIKYLNFFTNNIYEKQLTSKAIIELRKMMHFDKPDDNNNQNERDRTLVKLFDLISPDECAVCGTTKTYSKNNGRQYFEVHHVISFYNDKKVDNIANLVKLCPTCHDMLKKGRGTKEDQIEAIYTILNKKKEVYEFASSYLDIDNINKLVEKIWELLG